MTDARPAWLKQPYPFKLAHTWAKSTLIERMRFMGLKPGTSKSREALLLDLAKAVNTAHKSKKAA